VRIFCELRSIFPSPAGARKNTSNEQNVLSYYMLNHRISGLLFHDKKNCYFTFGLLTIFLVRVFRNILIPSVKMTLTLNKMIAGITCQTIEREVDYSTAKKRLFWQQTFVVAKKVKSKGPKQVNTVSTAIIAPSSAGFRPVVNRLN